MVFNKTTNNEFILPSKTYQRYLATRAASIWNVVQSDHSPFQ